MTHVERFGQFSSALSDMVHWASAAAEPKSRPLAYLAAEALRTGGRFYLPEAKNVLEGRAIDAEAKSLIRLPYDCTSVLSETTFRGAEPDFQSWKLSIAIDMDGDLNQRLKFIRPQDDGRDGYRFALLSLVWVPAGVYGAPAKSWMVSPALMHCAFPASRDGYEVTPFDLGILPRKDTVAFIREFTDDVMSVINLATMLSLHNVQRDRRDPPAAINKKREASGKQPLLSYHVLRVDGNSWDRPTESAAHGGAGKRSHLRRGHIRRLDGGARHVWVRSTYVHGSAAGFVAKDYDVAV